MADLLDTGLAWLNGQRERFLTKPVIYRRGVQEIEVPATLGRTVFRLDVGMGVTERVEARDYLIGAEHLTGFDQPKPGDRIIEDRDGQRHTAEVMAPGGEPAWRWSDPDRRIYRIHTKHLSTEAL